MSESISSYIIARGKRDNALDSLEAGTGTWPSTFPQFSPIMETLLRSPLDLVAP